MASIDETNKKQRSIGSEPATVEPIATNIQIQQLHEVIEFLKETCGMCNHPLVAGPRLYTGCRCNKPLCADCQATWLSQTLQIVLPIAGQELNSMSLAHAHCSKTLKLIGFTTYPCCMSPVGTSTVEPQGASIVDTVLVLQDSSQKAQLLERANADCHAWPRCNRHNSCNTEFKTVVEYSRHAWTCKAAPLRCPYCNRIASLDTDLSNLSFDRSFADQALPQLVDHLIHRCPHQFYCNRCAMPHELRKHWLEDWTIALFTTMLSCPGLTFDDLFDHMIDGGLHQSQAEGTFRYCWRNDIARDLVDSLATLSYHMNSVLHQCTNVKILIPSPTAVVVLRPSTTGSATAVVPTAAMAMTKPNGPSVDHLAVMNALKSLAAVMSSYRLNEGVVFFGHALVRGMRQHHPPAFQIGTHMHCFLRLTRFADIPKEAESKLEFSSPLAEKLIMQWVTAVVAFPVPEAVSSPLIQRRAPLGPLVTLSARPPTIGRFVQMASLLAFQMSTDHSGDDEGDDE